MKILRKYTTSVLFIVVIFFGSHSVQANILVSTIIDEATTGIDNIIEKAFSEMDLTLLKAALEARATIDSAADNLEDVVGYTFDRLDNQQKRIVEDLKEFSRMWTSNSTKLLEELRNERYSVSSDIKMLISDEPGAIRIVSGYAIEGENKIEFKLLGTALSNFNPKNVTLSGRKVIHRLIDHDDISVTMRINLDSQLVNNLVRRNNGRSAEVQLKFDVVEKILGIPTNTRKYSSLGYIIPKKLGTATVYFTYSLMLPERSSKKKSAVIKTERAKKSRTSRSRKSKVREFTIKAKQGWELIPELIKAYLERPLESGCSNRNSNAYVIRPNKKEVIIKLKAVTDKGYGSKSCGVSGYATYYEYREVLRRFKNQPKVYPIFVGKDVNIFMKGNDPLFQRVRIKSNLSKGEHDLGSGESIGGIKVNLSPDQKNVMLQVNRHW